MKSRKTSFAVGGFVLGFSVATLIFVSRLQMPDKKAVPSLTATSGSQGTFRVYLAGQVRRQGAVDIDSGRKITVTQTIIMDGGIADFGDAKRVVLMRKQADGTSSLIPVDFERALSGRTSDPVVQPGDLINVPQQLNNF